MLVLRWDRFQIEYHRYLIKFTTFIPKGGYNMNKKTIIGLALGAVTINVAVIGSLTGQQSLVLATTGSDYAFNLNTGKNALKSEDVTAQKATITSDSGHASVDLGLSGVSLSEGHWASVSSEGYVYNSTIIHGLLTFSATFEGNLTLYWSDVTINPTILDGVSSAALTSGSAHDFGEDYPNYFLLKSGDTSTISSISFTYDCEEHPVEFGRYPQTKVTDTSITSALASASDSDNDGYIEYGDNEYLDASGTYFLVEPIVWDVFDDGTLISQKILDASVFYTSDTEVRDGSIYPNNYKYSTARAYLNGLNGTEYGVSDYSTSGVSFISKAFTSGEQNRIATTVVDNSASTTSDSTSAAFISNTTNDKIYITSYADERNGTYFANKAARAKKYTDYVSYRNPEYDGWWRLRSPDPAYKNGNACYVVSDDGSFMGGPGTVNISLGLVPALKLA